MPARGASGVRERAIPHTACATIATATIFNPDRMPSPTAPPSAVAPPAKAATRRTAEGRVKAAKAASAPRMPARWRPSRNRPGSTRARQELAQRDQVGVGAVIHPLPPHDEIVAEIPQVRDRAAERREPQAEERAEHLGRSSRSSHPGILARRGETAGGTLRRGAARAARRRAERGRGVRLVGRDVGAGDGLREATHLTDHRIVVGRHGDHPRNAAARGSEPVAGGRRSRPRAARRPPLDLARQARVGDFDHATSATNPS